MIIFDQIHEIFSENLKHKTAKQIAELFNCERKTIYAYRDGCTFNCSYKFVIGLKSLGYDLVILKSNIANKLEKMSESEVKKNDKL